MALEKIETKREGSVYWVLYQPPKRIKLQRKKDSVREHELINTQVPLKLNDLTNQKGLNKSNPNLKLEAQKD